MSRRWIFIIGIVAFMVLVVLVTSRSFSPTQTAQVPSSIDYTNAITGQTTTDIIAESGDLTPGGTVNPPAVSIDGIDNVYSSLTSDQSQNAQDMIQSFLLARSGLTDVHCAIQQDSFLQSGNTTTFRLVCLQPQVSYNVTIRVANDNQAKPGITYKVVE